MSVLVTFLTCSVFTCCKLEIGRQGVLFVTDLYKRI